MGGPRPSSWLWPLLHVRGTPLTDNDLHIPLSLNNNLKNKLKNNLNNKDPFGAVAGPKLPLAPADGLCNTQSKNQRK